METQLSDRIELARQLLQNIRFAAMATVNEDGTPHNTPYFFMYDEKLEHLYWGSHPASLHSQNIERTGKIFVVLYDSIEYGRGGLYVTATNAHKLEGDELDEGLRVHNLMRTNLGKGPLTREYYEKGPQAMYGAAISKLEVHTVTRGKDGLIKEEIRREVSPADLLGFS